MNQREIQVWNDAVEACRQAAWAEVQDMEEKAADGFPNPARVVVRAVANQKRGDDERDRVAVAISASDFPQLK